MQMTKKVLSLVLAVLMVVSMMSVMAVGTATVASAATAKTVYFAKPSGWSTVNCYAWDANVAAVSAEWPGDSATFAYTNDYNEDVYSYSVPSTATGIIFSDNGSNQTANITSFAAYEQFYIDDSSVNSVQLVAKVGTKLYATFADAVNAANGSLINVLVKDATPYVMTVGQSIVTDNYTKITVQAPAGKAVHRAYDGTAKTYTFTVVDPVASYSDGTTTYYYDSLSAAVSAVPNATGTGTYTVNLLSDSTEASIVVGSALAKKNIDFNLGGHTLTLTRNYGNLFYARNGSHVSVDNGKVVFDTAYANGNGFVIDSAAATLNLGSDLDVEAKGTTSGISVFGGTVTSAADISAENSFAIATNGSKTPASASITINGGTITSDTIAIYQPGANSLTINNADVTGTTALYVKGGDVTINGGSYTGTGAKADYSYNGNGANATGDAIVVENAGSAYPANDVTIKNDAALSSTNGGYGLGAYTKEDTDAVEVALDNITIGSAYGVENASFTFANGASVALDTPADCKVVEDANGNKVVVPKDYVAEVDGTKYESVAEAIAAASSGDTVTLLANVTGPVTVPAGKNIVLDLNGKTISGGYYGIDNKGTLTVEGPGTVSGTYGVRAEANSKTTINGGTFNAAECAVATFKNDHDATITITGGTFTTADNSVLSGNGSANSGNNTWNVSGGTFNGNITTAGYVAAGIYAPNDDTWNITGGTFNVTNGVGIAQRAGNVNVSDNAEFNVTGDGTKGKVGDSRVVLPAGTALVYDSSANYPAQDDDAELSVTGGTFNASYAAAAGTEDDTRVAIEGGTFDKAVAENCCAEGFKPTEVDANGKYTVTLRGWEAAFENATYSYDWSSSSYRHVKVVLSNNGTALTAKADYEAQKDLWEVTYSPASGVVNSSSVTAKEGYMDISFKSAADGVVTITYSLKSDPTVTASTTVTINPVITGISTAKPALVQNGANAISELRVNGSAVNVNDYNFSTENTDIATIDGANITPSKAGTVTVKVYKKSAPETMIGTRNIVFTDTAVAKNGDTYYGTLASALSGAANNSTIELISNVATTSASSLSTGNTVTLDLCGYEVNSTSSTSAIRVSDGTLTVKDTDGSGKVANTNGYAFISGAGAAGNTANLVIESGTFEGLSTVAQAGVKTGTNSNPKYFPGNVEIKGGTFTATADTIGGVDFTLNKVDQVRDDSTISVTGGTFTGFDPANNTAEGAGTNFVADGYKSVNNGDGTYTVVEDDPLAPVLKEAENEITAAVARDLDGNLFGLDDNLQYKVGAILGVQRKNVIETNVADEGLRFVAEIDTELAKRADVDYGFVMTKVSGDNISTANFGEERFNQYLTVEKAGTTCSKFSCKGGTNTVVPQKYYGDPNSDESHKYTYVTYAVTNVASGKGVAARFYVTIGDKTYYANYTGTDYSGICSPDPTKLS